MLLGALSGSLAGDFDLSPIAAERVDLGSAPDDEDEMIDLTELAFASELDEELSP